MDDKGVEDAAILLMSLGEEEASEVFKHLAPKEVQRLGETIAKLKVVGREKVEQVLTRFDKVAETQSTLVSDTDEYVRQVLRKALGEDKANLLLDRILQGSDVSSIESLKWMDAASVAELLRNEHPQIIAAILAHLDFDQTSSVLRVFTERQRNEVLVRIATLDGIQPMALKDLNEVMSQVLAGGERMRKSSLGGVKTAAEIINMLGSSVEASVLDYIREADAELAQKIMDNMFTFDDLDLPDALNGPRLGTILHPEDGTEEVDAPYTRGNIGSVAAKYTLTDHLWDYLQRYAEKHRLAGNGFGFGLVGPGDVARTLSARYYKDGSEILVAQPGRNPRRLTPRECARLMGFDGPGGREFIIPVSDTQAYRQFGNSVVVPVVRAVAEHMLPWLVDAATLAPERLQRKLALAG